MTTPKGERIWFITGCSSGFGRAVAAEALRRGERVIGTLRRREQLADFEALAPGRAHAMQLDVSQSEQIAPAVNAAIARYGRIDVLFNNAGYGLLGTVEETSASEARAIFETNFFGTMLVTQAALPQLRQQRSGHILNMSSGAGIGAVPGLALYSASKFAVEGLSEALAGEVAAHGIKVTLIEPGAFRTGFPSGGLVETKRKLEAYAPITGRGPRGVQEWYAQAGDPQGAAEAILTVADSPAPPLRLVLGADALFGARHKLDRLRADFDAWEALSRSSVAAQPPRAQ